MESKPKKEDQSIEIETKKKFYEEEGSSRAITSGSLSMVFALFGSGAVWFFLILATGWEGLEYFGLTSAINTIIGVFSMGFGRYFIAEIKEAFVINEELGKLKAAAYCKILLLIGYSLGIGLIILSFMTSNKLLQISYLACGLWAIVAYTQKVFFLGLEILNRYDIIAFVSIFGGISLLIWAYMFIIFQWNPIYFAFHPFFNMVGFFFLLYFFHKKSPFSFKQVLFSSITSQKLIRDASEEVKELLEQDQVQNYFKNSIFSTITNMENLGIYGNLLIYFAALYLAIFNPGFQGLAVSLLTILMIYGAVKTVILYYSAPLNIECAEACARKNHQIIEESVNNSARISSMLALAFVVGMIALSEDLLKLLHLKFFIIHGKFDAELFHLAQVLFILIIIGQFGFGYATLFGNALIGSEHTREAGIGFGITLLIIIIASPICIFLFDIMGVGIVMIIACLFIVPYMLIQVKRKLQIELHFKMGRLIPNLIIEFLILWFFPIGGLLGFILKLIIVAIVYMSLNPFFGVTIPEDIKVIEDLLDTIKLKPLAWFFIIILKTSYNISPFNKDKISY